MKNRAPKSQLMLNPVPDSDSARQNFERLLDRYAPMVEQALDHYAWPDVDAPTSLIDAMSYSLNAGGKRLRPMLAFAAAEACGAVATTAMPVAAALEMIHTYSLIHDDLPAMDDDDLRRGKPTCHKVYGDATAILAGDAMSTYAMQVVLEGIRDPHRAVAVGIELTRGAGLEGMVGGQQADLESEGTKPDLERLRYIHSRKTGALITAAVVCGGICGGATDDQLAALREYGRATGLAFQVVDDVLDETATAEELGKSPGKDSEVEKQTYPRLMGLDSARQHAQALIDTAMTVIDGLENPEPLRIIGRYFTARTY